MFTFHNHFHITCVISVTAGILGRTSNKNSSTLNRSHGTHVLSLAYSDRALIPHVLSKSKCNTLSQYLESEQNTWSRTVDLSNHESLPLCLSVSMTRLEHNGASWPLYLCHSQTRTGIHWGDPTGSVDLCHC